MKNIFYSLLFVVFCLIVNSCKKDSGPTVTASSLNIVNATDDVSSLAINFSPNNLQYQQNTIVLSNGSAMEFGLPGGNNAVNLISAADTLHPLFHGTLNAVTGNIYSCYLSGSAAHYDTLFMKDNIPTYPDSSAGVRFVNLSIDSQPLSVNLQGNSEKEFSSIPYKKVTAFKKYAAGSNIINNGGYNFEIRNASGDLLAITNWVPKVFNKSNTFVITGLIGNASISVFVVNNY